MNCVKCGALLEEGSTSTLCSACQALEAAAPQQEKPVEVPPVENPEAPSIDLGSNPVIDTEAPKVSEDKPEIPGQPTSEI